jgi:hypothetical protein
MKKITINLFLLIVLLFITTFLILSTIGIETNKFNNFISDKVSQKKNINLKLNTIKFKLNPKKLSLFLETENPEITFKNIFIPIKNIKLYIDFLSLSKKEPKIEKIILVSKELDITQLKNLSVIIKPSNFKSLLNNKIKEGKVISEIEIFLTNQGKVKDFIARGTVKDLKAETFSDLNLKKLNLNFFADKYDILIKNIYGNLEDISILNGDVKLNLENGIKLKANFNSKLDLNEKFLNKYHKLFSKYKLNNLKNLKADFNNIVSIDLDNTYKIKNYNYSISGIVEEGNIKLLNPITNKFITKKIESVYLSNFKILSNFQPKENKFKGDGKYSFNNLEFLNFNLENNLNKDKINLKLNFDYADSLEFGIINYKKKNNSIANLSLNLEKKEDQIKINKINFKDGNNIIKGSGFVFNENKFSTFKKIEVMTANNDFLLQNGKKIIIRGNKFDATNLVKSFNKSKRENIFKNINNKIEIDFKNIKIPLSDNLKNFKLLGEIKNGQFVKISSKGDFGEDNYLDISMKKDNKSDKKYLEIYSDLTRPLLSEYSFFNGLSGGKLFFKSIISGTKSNSKLTIENFKVINAPAVIKLLSLADLGGLVDLAEGEGLSFDVLEIEMENSNGFLKLNEILALGPSMSVLMDGYKQKNGLTSLRGTLVPAKTLNKIISKIPIIGNIVIPKEVGEGLFGISFKVKGHEGKIKTTINPIKTLTPRFIQKIIERNKDSK